VLLTGWLSACSADQSCIEGETQAWVINLLQSAPVNNGVSEGFDLDDRVSEGADGDPCGVVDYTHPNGTPGIDNAMGKILSALAAVGGEAVEGLVAEAISSGELLILFEFTEVEELAQEGCVDLNIRRASGTPGVDSSGRILAGQTFDVRQDIAPVFVPGLQFDQEHLEARGFEMPVPATIFDTYLEFSLYDSALEFRVDSEGNASGALGGTLLAEDMRRTGDKIDEGVSAAVTAAVDHNADLLPNEGGACEGVSAVLLFEAVPAFLYGD